MFMNLLLNIYNFHEPATWYLQCSWTCYLIFTMFMNLLLNIYNVHEQLRHTNCNTCKYALDNYNMNICGKNYTNWLKVHTVCFLNHHLLVWRSNTSQASENPLLPGCINPPILKMCLSVAVYIANTRLEGTFGSLVQAQVSKSYTSNARHGSFPTLPPEDEQERRLWLIQVM